MSVVYESDSSESNDEIDEESTVDESQQLRDELGDIPLGEIKKLKETVSLEKYNECIFGMSLKNRNVAVTGEEGDDGDDDSDSDDDKKPINEAIQKNKTGEKKKRSEPEELSSKRRIYKPRQVVNDIKRKHRDPRFDNLSGKYNEHLFQKSYSFVEDLKKEELQAVKKQFKKAHNKAQKNNLHKLLQRMEEQEKFKNALSNQKAINKQRKQEEFQANKNRKKAFYMKKSDARKLELVDKFQKLQKSGQLDQYMRKKRKHISSKEKKKFLGDK